MTIPGETLRATPDGHGSSEKDADAHMLSGEPKDFAALTIPWQIKAVTTLGVTTVITIWAFWWLTQTIQPKVDAIHEMMRANVISQAVIQSQGESVIRILRANCVNQAINNTDRERCFQ